MLELLSNLRSCAQHSEAKQTETLELGTEEHNAQPRKENRRLLLKDLNSPMGFQGSIFKGESGE